MHSNLRVSLSRLTYPTHLAHPTHLTLFDISEDGM
jgi:hypothetical protein